MKHPHPYRTVFVVCWLSLAMLGLAWMCLHQGGEAGPKMFADGALALVGLGTAQAARSIAEHGGGGLRGALGALLGAAAPKSVAQDPVAPRAP